MASDLVKRLQEISDMDSYIEKVALDEEVAIQAAREVSESLGKEVSSEMLHQALGEVKKERHRFKAPQSFGYFLAKTYARRSNIWNSIKRPLLVIASLGALGFAGAKIGNEMSLSNKEGRAEQGAMAAYNNRITVSRDIEQTLNSPFIRDLTQQERTEFNSKIQTARENISGLNGFLSEYAPEGNSREVVNRKNMEFVLQQDSIASNNLTAARRSLDEAREYVGRVQRLVESKNILETQIADLQGPNPLIEQAREAYRTGIHAIESRDAQTATNSAARLRDIRSNISEIERVMIGIERDYNFIERVAQEDSIRNAIGVVYQRSVQNSESGNINNLRENAGEMSYVARVLPLDLNVRITGGTWMCPSEYETSNGGCRPTPESAKTWYLNVSAVDRNGRVVPLRIFSTRDNTIREVDLWGERVEQSQYDAIRQDKVGDGVIDNDAFGRKRPGYISIEHASQYPSRGQINRIWSPR